MEQLAIAQATYKVVSAAVKTGDPKNLRGQADAQLMGLYSATSSLGTPVKSMDLTVTGKKVGTVSVIEKGGGTKTVFDLTNADLFTAWLCEQDQLDAIVQYVVDHGEDFCEWFVNETGELPQGVEVRFVETPAKVSTTVRVDPKKVASALEAKQELPAVLAGLLEA